MTTTTTKISDNQLDYIEKLCGWKGVEFTTDYADLSADEASTTIDELKALPSISKRKTRVTMSKTTPKPVAKPATSRLQPNGVRLGMAMKVILQQRMTSELHLDDADSFRQQVWTIYQLMEVAEDFVEARLNKERGPR